jgi:uncharacterized protein YjbI with pentapeptide repeats
MLKTGNLGKRKSILQGWMIFLSDTYMGGVRKIRLRSMCTDPNRCDRGYVGNTIGQANAVSDRVLDLRQCKYPGANLSGKVLSGALMSEADFTKVNLQVPPQFPKYY